MRRSARRTFTPAHWASAARASLTRVFRFVLLILMYIHSMYLHAMLPRGNARRRHEAWHRLASS